MSGSPCLVDHIDFYIHERCFCVWVCDRSYMHAKSQKRHVVVLKPIILVRGSPWLVLAHIQLPVLYCTVLYCTALCTVQYTVLYCTVLVLYCTVLHCTALFKVTGRGYRVSPCRPAYFASPWWLLTLDLRRRSRETALLFQSRDGI